MSNRFRSRRNETFLQLIREVRKDSIRILDVGGRLGYWRSTPLWNDDKTCITVLNIDEGDDIEGEEAGLRANNISKVYGNALDLREDDLRDVDVLFSNSVIEHVGDRDAQARFARVFTSSGKPYFLQTPNRRFPIEPHFRVPFFAQFPQPAAVFLVRHFNLGCFRKRPDPDEAKRLVESVQCLSETELKGMFPRAHFVEERFLGLAKSFIVHNFPSSPHAMP